MAARKRGLEPGHAPRVPWPSPAAAAPPPPAELVQGGGPEGQGRGRRGTSSRPPERGEKSRLSCFRSSSQIRRRRRHSRAGIRPAGGAVGRAPPRHGLGRVPPWPRGRARCRRRTTPRPRPTTARHAHTRPRTALPRHGCLRLAAAGALEQGPRRTPSPAATAPPPVAARPPEEAGVGRHRAPFLAPDPAREGGRHRGGGDPHGLERRRRPAWPGAEGGGEAEGEE
ncbi:translation initiation factor IF-2-like [Panicum virgatum]|uniref:translation initiation factor IF-2-like n=1 Tax=Panicum virgatum TaxID=38727 RepID=UPI0019D6233D|nr:translation initiation factor IF-2-like [Panicum virgatum]